MIVVFPFAATAATAAKNIAMAKPSQVLDPKDPFHYWPDGNAIRDLLRRKAWTRQDLLDRINEPRVPDKWMVMGTIERCLRSNNDNPHRVLRETLEAVADVFKVRVAKIALPPPDKDPGPDLFAPSWDDLAGQARICDRLELIREKRSLVQRSKLPCRFHLGEEVRVRFRLVDLWEERAAAGVDLFAMVLIKDVRLISCIFPSKLDSTRLGLLPGPILTIPDLSDPEPFVVTEPVGAQTIYALLTTEPFERTTYQQLFSEKPRDGLDAMAEALAVRPDDQWVLLKREIEVVPPADEAKGTP